MKGILTLIRLAKRELDDLRKKQAALEVQKAKLEQAVQVLDEELRRETETARATQEMAAFYGGFAKRIRKRQDTLRGEIKKVDQSLDEMAEMIRSAFADLKKYEIARDQAKARQRAEEERKETIMLDEIAATQFLRKQSEES